MESWRKELYANSLFHHGILGMKWGKVNGPPYPLSASDHSSSEKKAGWRKSLKSKSEAKQIQKELNASEKEAMRNLAKSLHYEQALRENQEFTKKAMDKLGPVDSALLFTFTPEGQRMAQINNQYINNIRLHAQKLVDSQNKVRELLKEAENKGYTVDSKRVLKAYADFNSPMVPFVQIERMKTSKYKVKL